MYLDELEADDVMKTLLPSLQSSAIIRLFAHIFVGEGKL